MKTKRESGYNTKQLVMIRDYVKGIGDKHFTAAQVAEHFKTERAEIGRTTIYRHLDKLEMSGELRRYNIDGLSGACYQYVPEKDCATHFHLKCEECGDVIHLDCDMITEVHRHISAEHKFKVNGPKSVIYGTCSLCLYHGGV